MEVLVVWRCWQCGGVGSVEVLVEVLVVWRCW